MSTAFNQCPNCKRTTVFDTPAVFECGRCGTMYCRGAIGIRCGGNRCPACGSKEKREIGYIKPK